MASPLNGRVKRLESERGDEYARGYFLGSERQLTTEEWLELYCEGEKDTIEELRHLQRRSFVRCHETRVRKVPLSIAIEQALQGPALGKGETELWVCSSKAEQHELVSDLAKSDAFSHAFVVADLRNEMGLGPGRHRIEQ